MNQTDRRQSVNLSATAEVIEMDAEANEAIMRGPSDGKRRRDGAVIYAETRLKLWAAWARENRGTLGLPTISLLYKAMMQKSLKMKPHRAPTKDEDRGGPEITAFGTQTPSFIPPKVGEVPEVIAEVDSIVARLPRDLHAVIVADFFTYGPIEVRCKRTPWKRARYSQLLEAAKYAVFAALQAKS